MKKKKLTNDQKLAIIANSPEVMNAVKFLTAAFLEMKIKSFMRIEYKMNSNNPKIEGTDFEIIFQRIKTKNFQ